MCQVTSNSWYGDPWKYNCAFAPGQNAILIAESRCAAGGVDLLRKPCIFSRSALPTQQRTWTVVA